jgi:hypothetical protein
MEKLLHAKLNKKHFFLVTIDVNLLTDDKTVCYHSVAGSYNKTVVHLHAGS